MYLLHDKRLKDFCYLKGGSYSFYISLSALEKSFFLLELQSNFFSPGRQSYRLFVAWLICQSLESDLFLSVVWGEKRPSCVSPWAVLSYSHEPQVLQPDDWQEKWGERFLLSSNKNTNKEERETTD